MILNNNSKWLNAICKTIFPLRYIYVETFHLVSRPADIL